MQLKTKIYQLPTPRLPLTIQFEATPKLNQGAIKRNKLVFFNITIKTKSVSVPNVLNSPTSFEVGSL